MGINITHIKTNFYMRKTYRNMIPRIAALAVAAACTLTATAQIGRRFPSERKVINDPNTGVELVFLTSKSGTGDSKIYQTHNQWTSDGKWVVFRSDRVAGEAMAVNEETGDNFWHVAGSQDGHWVAGDDFARELWVIDRHTGERILLTAGHKTTARDHVHPTFKPDGTEIEIQSAMLSDDGRSMNICIVRMPQRLLDRYKNR